MPTAKARYPGDGAWTLVRDFSDRLRATLRGFYPGQQSEGVPPFVAPADEFIAHILAEARWAATELHWHGFGIVKPEIRAVQAELLRLLKDVPEKLRNLSPDFDRLLGPDADPLGVADKVAELIAHIESAGQAIDKQPTQKRPDQKQHRIAVEMAIRVLRVLADYDIAPAATADPDLDRASKAVQILKAIADDIGLRLSPVTWRDIVAEAKRAAPDLQ